jgi:hypothetical protein
MKTLIIFFTAMLWSADAQGACSTPTAPPTGRP